jgi:hypothetical protein
MVLSILSRVLRLLAPLEEALGDKVGEELHHVTAEVGILHPLVEDNTYIGC